MFAVTEIISNYTRCFLLFLLFVCQGGEVDDPDEATHIVVSNSIPNAVGGKGGLCSLSSTFSKLS